MFNACQKYLERPAICVAFSFITSNAKADTSKSFTPFYSKPNGGGEWLKTDVSVPRLFVGIEAFCQLYFLSKSFVSFRIEACFRTLKPVAYRAILDLAFLSLPSTLLG